MTTNVTPHFPDERALMRGISESSTEALASLYDRFAPVLYPLALHILGYRERAACVVEDLFEEVWRDRAQWSRSASVPVDALIRRCRELALAQAGKPEGVPLDGVLGYEAVGIYGLRVEIGETGGASDARRAAREALEALPERDRRALKEAWFRGTSARDIAILLGTPTSEAEAMLRRALLRFRARLDEKDGDGAEARASQGAESR
jgi:RNA polymerase sigma-70 factor (ECF subfamily)